MLIRLSVFRNRRGSRPNMDLTHSSAAGPASQHTAPRSRTGGSTRKEHPLTGAMTRPEQRGRRSQSRRLTVESFGPPQFLSSWRGFLSRSCDPPQVDTERCPPTQHQVLRQTHRKHESEHAHKENARDKGQRFNQSPTSSHRILAVQRTVVGPETAPPPLPGHKHARGRRPHGKLAPDFLRL